MIVLIRKTITGAEYWDTKEKRTLFVPNGVAPDFEVTENPQSMLTPEEDTIEVVPANQIVTGVINQELLASDDNNEDDSVSEANMKPEGDQSSELDHMTAKELRAYAKKNNIEIPAAIRAKGDILQFIQESES